MKLILKGTNRDDVDCVNRILIDEYGFVEVSLQETIFASIKLIFEEFKDKSYMECRDAKIKITDKLLERVVFILWDASFNKTLSTFNINSVMTVYEFLFKIILYHVTTTKQFDLINSAMQTSGVDNNFCITGVETGYVELQNRLGAPCLYVHNYKVMNDEYKNERFSVPYPNMQYLFMTNMSQRSINGLKLFIENKLLPRYVGVISSMPFDTEIITVREDLKNLKHEYRYSLCHVSEHFYSLGIIMNIKPYSSLIKSDMMEVSYLLDTSTTLAMVKTFTEKDLNIKKSGNFYLVKITNPYLIFTLYRAGMNITCSKDNVYKKISDSKLTNITGYAYNTKNIIKGLFCDYTYRDADHIDYDDLPISKIKSMISLAQFSNDDITLVKSKSAYYLDLTIKRSGIFKLEKLFK